MEKKLYAAYCTDHLRQTSAVTEWTLRPIHHNETNDGIGGNLELRSTAPIGLGHDKVYLLTLQEIPEEVIKASDRWVANIAHYVTQAKEADSSEPPSRKFRPFAEATK